MSNIKKIVEHHTGEISILVSELVAKVENEYIGELEHLRAENKSLKEENSRLNNNCREISKGHNDLVEKVKKLENEIEKFEDQHSLQLLDEYYVATNTREILRCLFENISNSSMSDIMIIRDKFRAMKNPDGWVELYELIESNPNVVKSVFGEEGFARISKRNEGIEVIEYEDGKITQCSE